MAARSYKKNQDYLRRLVAPLLNVPADAAVAIATRIFGASVEQTAFDSGQAALNWRIQPYVGQPTYEQQTMLWGYGEVSPTPPAGYKYSGGANEEEVKMQIIQGSMVLAVMMRGATFDGISVYNPIQPGYSGFAPGNDANYYFYALGPVEIEFSHLVAKAIKDGYAWVAAKYDFGRAR